MTTPRYALAGQSCASDYSIRQPQSSVMPVPRVAGPLLQAIAATTAWLKQANISAAVIGGVAASLLGRPRVTKDVDLVALADDGDVPRLLSLGHEHGFEPRVADAIAFAKVSRVLLLKHEPSGIEIDLSLAGLPFEREVIERAVERSVRGVSFRVATPEDVVVMKAARDAPARHCRRWSNFGRRARARLDAHPGLLKVFRE